MRLPRATHLVILVAGSEADATQERAALADYLREAMGLELSLTKTRVTDLREGFTFLGHRVRYKWHPRYGMMPRVEIPRERRADFRHRVKSVTCRGTIRQSLATLLQKLNRLVRGWGNYYRFCTSAGRFFATLDRYVGDRIWRWLMKKHDGLARQRSRLRRQPSRERPTRRVWRDGRTEQALLSLLRVERFRRGSMRTPAYAMVLGEPDA